VRAFVGYQQQVMEGKEAIMPRGGRPKRAPTYRFLHWNGELGDPSGRLVGPLSVKPELSGGPPYVFNAQILGFHTSTADFSESVGQGALSVEFRSRYQDESLTWMYLQQFEVRKAGGNSVGLEYIAQRDGQPVPVVSDAPNLDVRIQLIRYRKAPGVLRKILKVGAFLTGLPIAPGAGGETPSFVDSEPAVRVPRMVHEGVALAQATIGGMSDEAPIWRGGFNSFALAGGGGLMALRPGLWVAVDDSEQIDYAGLRLEDIGGRIGLRLKDEPLDVNYLVLNLEMGTAAASRAAPPEVIPKGKS
jgi:hypothetical protein